MTTLSWNDGTLLRNGAEHRILAGAMHYFRVHPGQWADRIDRLVALGVNTLDTYVAWNFHERREGEADFTGWRDLERFISLAGDAGLDVLVRPGPYICAEWSNGGLPVWLTARTRALRTNDQVYLDAIDRWFDELIPRIAPLQAVHGGPIVGVQVENEYGSFGSDAAHLEYLRDGLRSRGIGELLFTADGTTADMLRNGTVAGTLPTLTFGSGATLGRQLLDDIDPNLPLMVAEFWNGWFDHWQTPHHGRSPESVRSTLDEILGLNGSVTLYMAHGGTNFGLWAGANHDSSIQSTTTSYDYDAPIGEDGRPGIAFEAIRAAFEDLRGDSLPPVPALPELQPEQKVQLSPIADLLESVRGGVVVHESPVPATFDELGLDEGFVLYEARADAAAGGTLAIDGLRDRAIVFADGVRIGTLERDVAESLELPVDVGTLELLVETRGRINYGHHLGEHKGIVAGVRVGRRLVHGWRHRVIDLDVFEPVASPVGDVGCISDAVLDVAAPLDAWLAVDGAAAAFVWVNGVLLGRLRDVGPQRTLYAPAPLWLEGPNNIRVLDLDGAPSSVRVTAGPEFGERHEFTGS